MSDSPRHDRPPTMAKVPSAKDRLAALEAELKGRISEAEWLKSHYDEQLRDAFAQIAVLQARSPTPPPPAASGEAERLELERLRNELARLTAAEARYLDRIEELKEVIARGGR